MVAVYWVAAAAMYWVAILLTVTESAGNVTYDGRSLIIDSQRKLLFSGAIHYPRSTPQMWKDLIGKAKEGGIDVIQTYVFWNLHEPKPGEYDFSGRYDIVKFIKEIEAQGLYVSLRIGPFIESEWTYGGLPFWLHDVPGIVYRTDNGPFKFYMQNFTTKIVDLMKSENLYASQGGPIILTQIENEYGNVEAAFGEKGKSYVKWAAKMALDLRTGVPWIMCKQPDAPDPLINTCNGMRCGETFTGPNSPTKPSLWTENWTSFYQVYGGEAYIRSAQDIAYHVALFIAKNGSFVNYYMYHGGTNFGRMAAAYVITSYYDQAPLDEYGMKREPKWGHLKELHGAIKSCSETILEGKQTNFSLGPNQEAYVFQLTATSDSKSSCSAFLLNSDNSSFHVDFQNKSYELLPHSISILPDCNNITFNTAAVKVKPNRRITKSSRKLEMWDKYADTSINYADTSITSNSLLEHMTTTKDKSDYLWYTFSFEPKSACGQPILHVESVAHVVNAFVNNKFSGSGHGSKNGKGAFILEVPIVINELGRSNNISLLSVMVGLPDSGAFLEKRYAGLTRVEIQCTEQKEVYNFTTNYNWGYQVGLLGEELQIYSPNFVDTVNWTNSDISLPQPLTWYKTNIEAPKGDDPVAVNLEAMGKGEAWVNGQSIGRYWISFLTSKSHPSQTLYHIPREFLANNSSSNMLVIMEELGGNPLKITLNTLSTINLPISTTSSL